MLIKTLTSYLAHLYLSLKSFNLYSLAIVTLFFWLIWRLWTFTIVPKLRPHNPVVLPYNIPIVGHTFSWLWDRSQLLEYGHKYFPGDSPFALFIGGYTVIVVRNTDGIKAIWNDPKSFTFDDYMRGIVKGLDNPAKLWKGGECDAPHFVKDNPAKKRLVSLQENWMKDALQPGDKMKDVSEILMENIKQLIPLNLFRWGRYVLVDAATRAFIGAEILDIDPDFVQHSIDWENVSWKIVYGHPKFLSKDMVQLQEVLVQTLMKYFALNPTDRSNLSWLFDTMQSDQRKIGFTDHDVGAASIIMLWGIHLNPPRLLFWILAHILCSPSLTQSIRDETSLAFNSTTNSFSIGHLMNNCPILTVTWHKALRLCTSSSVVRTCESLATIGDKTINAGDRLIGPFAFVHRSPEIWGDDADDFDEQRWLDGPEKMPKGFYPFGGGHMHCRGRWLAKQEVILFIAILLREYEIEPVGKKVDGKGGDEMRWKLPEVPSEHAGAAGISNANEEFLVRVTERCA